MTLPRTLTASWSHEGSDVRRLRDRRYPAQPLPGEGSGPAGEQHREDPTGLRSRGRDPQLVEHAGDILLDGALRDEEPGGDACVGVTFGHQPEYLALSRGEPLRRAVGPPAVEERGDDLRVDR